MTWMLLTMIGLVAFIIVAEWTCWRLFRRRTDPMRFPSPNDPTGSHTFYLRKLRIFMLVHSAVLITFTVFFCIGLWQ